MVQLDCSLKGIRFLIVEDELTQALALEDMVNGMGGIISNTVFDFEEARRLMHNDGFDCALLDVNLNGTLSFPIADELGERGIPFIFCTGFSDGIDAYPRASEISVVDKPIQPNKLLNAVLSAVRH